MKSSEYDFLVLGAGIFGVTTAIELRTQGYRVALLNPDRIPHPLAASTDISKAVRMEYGADKEYFNMAAASIDIWHQWNQQFDTTLYHEVGFLLLTRDALDSPQQTFEQNCWQNLCELDYHPQRLTPEDIKQRFPAFNSQYFVDGMYQPHGGYAEAAKTVTTLCAHARSQGVMVMEGQTADRILSQNNRVVGVTTREGSMFAADQVVVCAGNFTPYLLPELKPYFRITGHPVFHVRASTPSFYEFNNCPVFGADISNTGWYGFPNHPHEKVVKFGKHSLGLELDPNHHHRKVSDIQIQEFKRFLKIAMPDLADDPIVYTRLCCYTDTLDGHFWIDRHPEISGLTVGSGGSGHGFKMAPIIGKMIAEMALTGCHLWSDRYQWRELGNDTVQTEEARYKPSNQLP